MIWYLQDTAEAAEVSFGSKNVLYILKYLRNPWKQTRSWKSTKLKTRKNLSMQ